MQLIRFKNCKQIFIITPFIIYFSHHYLGKRIEKQY